MRGRKLFLAGGVLTALALLLAGVAPRRAAAEDITPKVRAALVKVYTTSQGWDRNTPWNKYVPRNSTARGVMVRPGIVLTTSTGMADNILVEVSVANSARRYPAKLIHKDLGIGLALVRIEDEELAKRMAPLPLGDPITLDDEIEAWQIGSSDLVEKRTGKVMKVSPSGARLNLTIKTNLSDRGNGQVALKDGKIVGLVIGTYASRQEGTVLSIETIRHYLDDWASGDYKGFGAGGLWWHKLLRDDLRSWFKVPDDAHGVVISHVVPGRTGAAVLREGDVITSLGGHDLDDEGMFLHPLHGRLHMNYLLRGSVKPGEKLPAKILRNGEPMDVQITVRSWPRKEQLVPANSYDLRPKYMIVGGLLVMELTQRSGVGGPILNRYKRRAWWDPQDGRKRVVFGFRVLEDEANKGLDDIGNVAIRTVNGKPITRIEDVAEALKTPVNGFHVFHFEGIEKDYVVRADKLTEIDRRISKRYRITELSYLGK